MSVNYLMQEESLGVHAGRESDKTLHKPRSTLNPGIPSEFLFSFNK